MVTRGHDRPATDFALSLEGGEQERPLAELRRSRARAARTRHHRGAFERRGHSLIRSLSREREVARLPLCILDERGESAVNRAAVHLIGARVGRGGEKGMSEADAFAGNAHDVRFDRRLQRQAGFAAEDARHACQPWLGQAGGDQKCALGLARKDGDANFEELPKRSRNGESPTERGLGHFELESPRDLERVERVPT